MENIRVCHANNDNKGVGGAYIIIRRVENKIRKYGFIFDYMTMDEFVVRGDKDLDLLSDSIAYSARLRKNRLIGHIKLPFYAYSVFKREKYKIVHINVDLAGKAALYAIPAKLSGSKVILHSHSSGIDGDYKLLKAFAQCVFKQLLPFFLDGYLACSGNSAEWMFPKRVLKKAIVIENRIELSKYYYDQSIRELQRKKLNLNKQLVIGNVGIISKRKNQELLVKLLGRLKSRGIDAVLLLVGSYDDEWEAHIKETALKYNVSQEVILYGFSNEINGLLNAIDIYVCPSLIEGAPLSLHEAQATGLPCIMTDTLSDESQISNWVERASLSDDLDVWCDLVLKMNEKYAGQRETRKVDEKYGLDHMAAKLKDIYTNLLTDR